MSIEKIKAKNAKMNDLLYEYEKAKKSENCDYHLVLVDRQFKQYSLIRLLDNQTVCHGSMSRINSFTRLRNISSDKILKD